MTASPECAEAPKLCPLSSDGAHILDRLTERCAYCRKSAEDVFAEETVSQPTPTPASGEACPIQAGDWVECIGDYPVKAEVKQGCRYQVAFTEVNSFGEPCLRVTPYGLRISTAMFKRVDGPHPAKDSAEPERVTSAPATVCSVAPAVPDTGLLRDKPTCSECKAPAVLNGGNLCGYCCYRLGHNETYVMWANHGSVANTWARHRREAIEQKRPMVANPSDRREFARAHPWEEFDEMESR